MQEDEKKITLWYKKRRVKVRIPQENVIYNIRPKYLPSLKNEKTSIKDSLENPIHSVPLSQRVKKGMKVVIIGDDITRPTPRQRIFLPLLNELNKAGIPDNEHLQENDSI